MSIKEEFFKRLDRTYQQAEQSAQVSTRYGCLEAAGGRYCGDAAAAQRGWAVLKGSERKAQTVYFASMEQAEVDIDQAEGIPPPPRRWPKTRSYSPAMTWARSKSCSLTSTGGVCGSLETHSGRNPH